MKDKKVQLRMRRMRYISLMNTWARKSKEADVKSKEYKDKANEIGKTLGYTALNGDIK